MTMSSSHRPGEITADKANHWIIILMDQQTAAHIKKDYGFNPISATCHKHNLGRIKLCGRGTPEDGCECKRRSADPFQSKTLEACINV